MPIVSIVRAADGDVLGAVREAVKLAGGLPPEIGPGAKVLLKPNVVNPSASGSGHVTDARVTEAVARLVLEREPAQVIIGEGSSVGYDFVGLKDSLDCLEKSGTADVARRLGLPLVDLNRDERVAVHAKDAYVMADFAIARTAYEADAIIDLPVIKTHIRTGITVGLKNMKGVLPGHEKKRTHQLGLDRGIVDLNRVVRPRFTLVDALVGQQGTHTRPEDRMPMNCLLAGADVVAVDAVCGAVMGFDVAQIHHVQLAAEAGLGVADLAQIQVRGLSIAEVRRPFLSYTEALRQRYGAVTLIEKNACTGCMGEILSPVIYLQRAGYEDRLADLTLIFGTPDAVPEIEGMPVVLGRCARAYRHLGVWVPGCPPHGIAITDAVCEALGIDKELVHRAIETLHDF
ncbi:MAG: DUF362 domain-containing protein [Anaerolineae bacterium]|nr:DUF362 domain-containing protein [Anaerolineae bacterium]